jgi:hypothetical protein
MSTDAKGGAPISDPDQVLEPGTYLVRVTHECELTVNEHDHLTAGDLVKDCKNNHGVRTETEVRQI